MPLIRIVGHPLKNDEGVDKLIFIDGLPDSMFYQDISGWEYDETEIEDNGEPRKKFRSKVRGLKAPWEIDYPDNIPKDIRAKYGIDETVYEQVMEHVDGKRPEKVVVPRHVVGFKLDYQANQGEIVWRNIQRILERDTPRERQVPEPALVGDRRTWKLDLENVPEVRLSPILLDLPRVQRTEPVVERKAVDRPVCCGKEFKDKRGLHMHNITKHKQEVAPVGA